MSWPRVSQIATENLLVMPHNKALIISTLIILLAPKLQDQTEYMKGKVSKKLRIA